MKNQRTSADDDRDRDRLMDYLKLHPWETFEEAQLKILTGVAKARIRGLLRGHPDVDQQELENGRVRLAAANA